MYSITVVIDGESRDIEAILTAEALRKAAKSSNDTLTIEIHTHIGTQGALTDVQCQQARNVLIVSEEPLASEQRFSNAKIVRKTLHEVLNAPEAALASCKGETLPQQQTSAKTPVRIVAVTSCPTGIAHTFMAAEGLEQAAAALGYTLRVETQGSVGSQSTLQTEEISSADVVIIAADREVDLSRFQGKRLFKSATKPAINNGKQLIADALANATIYGASSPTQDANAVAANTSPASESGNFVTELKKAYKHLMNGISFMLPAVTASGLIIALAFAAMGNVGTDASQHSQFANWLMQLGGITKTLIVPLLAGYIAFSIADRPGLVPGMVGGLVAAQINAGFLGGIVAGYIAGYGVNLLNRYLVLPRSLNSTKPVLVLPLLGTLLVGLVMLALVGPPITWLMDSLTQWLKGLQGSSALVLGAILGAMMAFDLGGPINKVAYTFAVGLLATGLNAPMAAVMAAGMTPPLGAAFSAWLLRNRHTPQEIASAPSTAIMGLIFVTEGAIPYAARDPMRSLPAFIIGSATAGMISLANNLTLPVPHGGIFVLLTINQPIKYALAILVGTGVTVVASALLKKKL